MMNWRLGGPQNQSVVRHYTDSFERKVSKLNSSEVLFARQSAENLLCEHSYSPARTNRGDEFKEAVSWKEWE
jgi:hypothetical protein